VTFILATTEPHKFPVTIVSRCQHFVFRQIPEAALEAHVVSVLEKEGRAFEPEAARLVARRAAGSVRDAMSLLGQALALGGDGRETLSARQTREVLGLAGQEVMDRLLDALAGREVAEVTRLVRELMLQGVDMGFFLRELGGLWRNLFLLRQTGPAAGPDLGLPESEMERLSGHAARFSPAYIHAAWQMTLDGQRRILTSLEPAAGLELLLLNLALLPRLLPLSELNPESLAPAAEPLPARNPPVPEPAASRTDGGAVSGATRQEPPAAAGEDLAPEREKSAATGDLPDSGLSWSGFLAFCEQRGEGAVPMLRRFSGEVRDSEMILGAGSRLLFDQLQQPHLVRSLEKLAAVWAGKPLRLVCRPPLREKPTEAELREEMKEHPVVRTLEKLLDASLLRCVPLDNTHDPKENAS
jgi:DNA polymerase-3 subunit gamma/tau